MELRMMLPWCLLLSWMLLQLCHANQPILIDAGPERERVRLYEDDLLNSVYDSPLGKNLNEIVDMLIQFVQEALKKSGRSTIKIPDIEEDFHKRIHFISITGKFKAENGWFQDLSTIHRTRDATLSHSGGNITASIGLGLGTMKAGYDHYSVKVKHLSVSGSIKATVASNSVSAKVGVTLLDQGKCNLTLQELKIDQFSGLKVKVEGKSKPVDWLLSKIATSVVNHIKGDAIHQAEQELAEAARKALDKYHC